MKTIIKFIPFTLLDGGEKIFVNVLKIGAVIPNPNGSELIIQGVKFLVKESTEDIERIVNQKKP